MPLFPLCFNAFPGACIIIMFMSVVLKENLFGSFNS